MKRVHYKFIFLGFLTVLGILLSMPSWIRPLPDWWRTFLPTEGMKLGLDLQGGMHLILKVDLPQAIQNQLETVASDLRDTLKKHKIPVDRFEYFEKNRMRFTLLDAGGEKALKKILREDFPNLSLSSGSTVEGGKEMELGLQEAELRSIRENAVTQSLEIIRNRIDQFGVSEPVIVKQGSDEIVVQLPGIKETQRAIDLIGKTAQLEFRLVDEDGGSDVEKAVMEAIRSGRLDEDFSREEVSRLLRGHLPPGDEVYPWRQGERGSGSAYTAPLLLKKKAVMTGDAVKTARVEIGSEYNEPYVAITLNSVGARLFERITGEHVNERLAIILDDVVQSAPVIRERISGGRAQITGSFTMEEANDLAIVLTAGALPAPVKIVQNLTVGPSLGRDSIQKGIASAVLGTILVVAFMIVYYRLSGTIANLALFLNLILMVAALSLFHATLTLPGIAGIILSIGMAVDSNVLIFERMREESETGKTLRSVVQGGYDKALWTIIDSHVTTLITAFALFLFGTGPIKGFAVTLSLGVILNLFTALYGTRAVYDYLIPKKWIRRLRFLQIIKHPGINFLRLRKAAFPLSSALVILGLFAFLQISLGRANLGVDFTGGTIMQFKAERTFLLEDIRTILNREGITDYELQEVPKENILIVRIRDLGPSGGASSDRVSLALSRAFPANGFLLESSAEIGASVSKDLKEAALIAIAISLAGIIMYLAWRFDLGFGVAAAIATFHDVLAVLGIFYLLNKEITLLIVTALLTLAGYSLTDTVVVFDRIRENMKKGKRRDFGEIINLSINEVLSRTIITSTTVMIVLAALLLWGGVLIEDFALALMIGVVVGTYSSVFVASPIVYIRQSLRKSGKMKTKGEEKSGRP